MTSELYIDGQRVDMLRGSEGITLEYQSPLLAEVEDVVSNHTLEIVLPMTMRNARIFGYVGTQADVEFPYRRHRAEIRIEGVTIAEGDVVLLGHDKGGLSLSVVWGNEQTWQKLDAVSLRDLQDWESAEDYINVNRPTQAEAAPYLTTIDYGKGWFTAAFEGWWLPALRIEDVIDRIEQETGVQIGAEFDDYLLQLGAKATAEEGRAWESVRTGVEYLRYTGAASDEPGWTLYYGTEVEQDNYGLIQSTSKWRFLTNDNGIRTARVSLPDIEIVRTGTTGDMIYSVFGYLNEGGWKKLWTAPSKMTATQLAAQRYKYKGAAVETDVLDVSGCQYIVVCVDTGIQVSGETIESVTLGGSVTITPNPDSVWQYPLYYNLPDMTCGEFVKQLMKVKGLYANCTTEGTVTMHGVDDLYRRIADSVDWTEKVKDWRKARYEFTMDGMARRNWLRYAGTDDVAKGSRDWHIDVDNENIEEKESELVGLELGTIDAVMWNMPVYETDDEGRVTFRETEARLMRKGAIPTSMLYATTKGLDWKTIVETYWQRYADMVRRPVVVTADVVLTMQDVVTLDMMRPVYLRQTGRFYGIQTLTAGADGVAEVRLIEMPVSGEYIENPFTLDVSELDGEDELN